MPSQPIDTGWGFNAVIDLIESDYDAASPTLSTASPVRSDVGTPEPKSAPGSIAQTPLDSHIPRLGDFTKLFNELGISTPPPLAPASPVDSDGPTSSDDAILSSRADAANCGDPDSPLAGPTAKAQKKERKKAAKKERKEARRALKALHAPDEPTPGTQAVNQPRTRSNVGAKIRPATPAPLETHSEAAKPQPSTKAVNLPHIPTDPAPVNIPSRRLNSLAQPFTPSPSPFAQSVLQDGPVDGFGKPAVQPGRSSLHEVKPSSGPQQQTLSSFNFSNSLVPRTVQSISTPRVHVSSATHTHGTPTPQPVASSRLAPPATGPRLDGRTDAELAPSHTGKTPYQLQSPTRFATPTQLPVTPGKGSTSFIIRPRVERHLTFLNQLLVNFTEDSYHLLAPMPLNTEERAAQGIHCFVDASNIMIGFRNLLRESGAGHHQLEMSFDTLALLMERRRPVAKRIYASSQREANPLPHITKLAATSKAVGYENLIQEQVFIRREDSDRKKFFKDVERLGWTKATQLRSGGGSGSDSETGPANAASPNLSAPKWVEQGVDEILHLKMCQSVLDTEVPTTMVLATGDGNAAELSDGFLANVERALKKGWKVELVSWKQQMSAAYRNKKWRTKWGEKFRVVELDEYLESLIDTQ